RCAGGRRAWRRDRRIRRRNDRRHRMRRRGHDQQRDKKTAVHLSAFHWICRHEPRPWPPSPAVSPIMVTEPEDVLTYLFSNGGRPDRGGARRKPAAAGMLETARPLALSLVPFRSR